MNSVLFARVRARADRSSNVGSARVRGTLGPLLVTVALSCASLGGCSFHARSEWHSGNGSTNSSGAEHEAQPEQHEHAHRSSHRQSPGGRDNVVRVTGSTKSSGDQGGGADGEEPARTAVHPTGDVPASSSGSSGSSGGGSGSSGGGSEGSGTSSGSSAPAADAPAQTAEPAADASRDEGSSTGKGTLKSPSEPHVTTPSQRKPRKVHRSGDGQTTNKEGRRE